jgi:caffeoyl-CoA O-methyltransferase
LDLISPLVEEYARIFSSPEDSLQKNISDFTYKNHPEAHMLSGHLQGKFLELISILLKPRRILEIGTFTGYSAVSLAKGLPADGQLHTIELRKSEADKAREFFSQSPYHNQIILHTGSALDIIPNLDEIWDLVFIDADKPSYVDYFNLVFPKLRKNGVILADNIFFHGEVLEDQVSGKNAKGIQAFNELIRNRTDVEKLVLTLRDGLFIIRKS